MLLFMNVRIGSEKSIIVIPLNKIITIKTESNKIKVEYMNGLNSTIIANENEHLHNLSTVVEIEYETPEDTIAKMRDFYTSCAKDKKAFFF